MPVPVKAACRKQTPKATDSRKAADACTTTAMKIRRSHSSRGGSPPCWSQWIFKVLALICGIMFLTEFLMNRQAAFSSSYNFSSGDKAAATAPPPVQANPAPPSSEVAAITSTYTPQEWWQKEKPLLSEFPVLQQRNDIIPILERLKFKTGIEVGVQRGIFAKKILSTWKSCEEYKLVDLWGREANYKEPGDHSSAEHNQYYREAQNRMAPWTARNITEFFPMRSTDAADLLKDSHFDWVYIDARHDYCAVKEDIEYYWPKVRPGGILAGHDFVDAQYAVSLLGTVASASTGTTRDLLAYKLYFMHMQHTDTFFHSIL